MFLLYTFLHQLGIASSLYNSFNMNVLICFCVLFIHTIINILGNSAYRVYMFHFIRYSHRLVHRDATFSTVDHNSTNDVYYDEP